MKKVLNPKFKSKVLNYLFGYVLIAIGAVMTFIVQSSSVFTSTLTPLVGIGMITVETCYPLFLGSNIGELNHFKAFVARPRIGRPKNG